MVTEARTFLTRSQRGKNVKAQVAQAWLHHVIASHHGIFVSKVPRTNGAFIDKMEPRRSDDDPKACAQCHKLACPGERTLLTCKGCKQAFYCGQDCQRKHWKASHKNQCAQPREKKDMMAEATKKEPEGASSTGTTAQHSKTKKPLASFVSSKKKGASSSGDEKECANCSSSRSTEGGGALLACTRCKTVYYCGRPCQI